MAKTLLRSLQTVGSGIRTGWLLLGVTLILIIVCEAGLRLALTTWDWLVERQPLTEHKINRSAPVDSALGDADYSVEWKREYSKAFDEVRRHVWQPYVYWRHAPYRSGYLNVDQNGLRATWNPPTRDGTDDPPPVRVFTFGGSTMWGWGARDDHTIASYLSKLLHEQGYRAEVTNYGQLGYVTTQEVIALLRCIQRGEVPDIVLFYDGINDVVSSYFNDEAGLSITEAVRRAEFRLSWRPKQLARIYGRRFPIENLWGFHRLATGLQRRPRPQAAPPPPSDDALVRQTVRMYEANLTLVESLGRSYGFDPLFYWQPVIFSKRHRSPYEQYWAERLLFIEQTPNMEQMYDAIYRRIQRSQALNSRPHFHDIGTLFHDLKEPHYRDFGPISRSGNRLIAAAMVNDVIGLIEQRRAGAEEKRVR
ncbi:SGNH/GDSL hydrolase family protein [Candidatus Thiosymbion oneisti]|uniref:SGNH/GDSL hydrolase family protein n=1 Tax=Candidatus Thiosymbion oneisti TaxID=589554 RepID=UPI000B7F7E57|nr:SGNH/GDSL hydrolase family protein [Candidatus Thiosymbion oneisti]